jgi:hypothetical protein
LRRRKALLHPNFQPKQEKIDFNQTSSKNESIDSQTVSNERFADFKKDAGKIHQPRTTPPFRRRISQI